jgi:hypothetical protein
MQDQVKQLKLNVTNIKSYLIPSNKKLKKLQVDKNNIIATEQDQNKKADKEKTVESPLSSLGKFGKTVGGIAKNILSGPLSFFDKIKEFFGLILTGIIINNLPAIIDQIKGFLDRNKWLVEGTKFILSAIGKGIQGIINLVNMFSPSEQGKINKDATKLRDEFGRLDKDLEGDDVEINKRLVDLEKENNRTQRNERSSPTPTPSSTPTKPQRESATPPQPIPPKAPELPKYAKGGKVDTRTQPQARKTMTAGSSSLGSTKSSVRSKKAVQTVNYFSFFRNNTEVSQEIADKDAKNKDTFREILTSLKTIQEIRKQIGDDDVPGQRPGTSPGQPSPGEPIDVNPNEVIGTVGHTGNVRPAGPDGTHIHIENNTTRGGSIPSSVKNNVFVSGVPMPQRLRFSSGIMEPGRPNHMGEDYAGEPNQPITLGGGLKFVQYIPDDGGGYGNRVIIQASDGTQYSLNHLNAGPTNLRALQEKQNQQRAQKFGTPSGQASWYGPGFYGNRTANGELFKENDPEYTAAHRTLAFGSRVKVTNTKNGKSIIVRINDRGPFHDPQNRIIDLNKSAMDALGGSGLIDVKLEEVSPGQQRASLTPTERRGGFIGEDTDSSNIASLGILPVFIDRTKIAAVPLPVA